MLQIFSNLNKLKSNNLFSQPGAGVSVKQKAVRRWNEACIWILNFQHPLVITTRTTIPLQLIEPTYLFLNPFGDTPIIFLKSLEK